MVGDFWIVFIFDASSISPSEQEVFFSFLTFILCPELSVTVYAICNQHSLSSVYSTLMPECFCCPFAWAEELWCGTNSWTWTLYSGLISVVHFLSGELAAVYSPRRGPRTQTGGLWEACSTLTCRRDKNTRESLRGYVKRRSKMRPALLLLLRQLESVQDRRKVNK